MNNKIKQENLDVTEFINSRDIRDFHRKINYEYSPVEAAHLVKRSSKHTLKQKHEAFNIIIQTTPDCSIENQRYYDGEPWTLHELLRKHMANENKYLDFFFKQESDSFYTINPKGRQYSTYQECFNSPEFKRRKKRISKYNKKKEKDFHGYFPGSIPVSKYYVSEEMKDTYINIRMDCDGNIMLVYCYPTYPRFYNEPTHPLMFSCDEESINNSLEFFAFDFPIPFKKGDIVFDEFSAYGKPFIYNGITAELFDEETRKESYPVDMGVSELHLTKEGKIVIIEGDFFNNYMDLEYYRG